MPSPFHFGFAVSASAIIGFCLTGFVSSIESIGDVEAICEGSAGRRATDRELIGAVGADGELVDDEDEQKVIAEAKRLRAEGKSLRATAAELTKKGYRSRETEAASNKKDNKIGPTQVRRMTTTKKP